MTQYAMSGQELGIYMEIYVPKRTIYQPFLFDVLTKGFEIEHVRSHFLCQQKRPGILKLLGGYTAWNDYDENYVSLLRPFFYGYSMYEVDGVFTWSTSTAPIVEERTQIIRLIFRLDIDEIAREANAENESKQMIRARVSDYLRAHHRDHIIEKATGQDRQIYEAAKEWRDQLGFFVFGYIIYGLCTQIEQLYDSGHIAKTEGEIWVTHFANLEIDRIVWPFSNAY